MLSNSYPSNYFDPYDDKPVRAQCTECGEWKDVDDMVTGSVERVPCLEFGIINQGICLDCKES